MKLTFLGTGTSHGIPVIGCHCPVCTSSDPHDNRYRSSILIEKGDTKVIIDTGCEFRLQALRCGLDSLDGVLYTHAHADHLMGLDDLRVFTGEARRLPIYSFASVLETIRKCFPYAFAEFSYKGVPRLEMVEVKEGEIFHIGDISFQAIPVLHGAMRIAGYRFGKAAYITDVSDLLLEENAERLSGLDVLIIGALRTKPHWSHFSFDQALENARRINAGTVYFTHINHETSDAEIRRRYLPDACPAYDTLTLEVDDE